MILKDIKEYVQSRQQVSLTEIAVHFDADPEALKGMLDFWIRKGKIKHYSSDNVCGGSCSCSQKADRDVYEWNPQFGNISIQVDRLLD